MIRSVVALSLAACASAPRGARPVTCPHAPVGAVVGALALPAASGIAWGVGRAAAADAPAAGVASGVAIGGLLVGLAFRIATEGCYVASPRPLPVAVVDRAR